MFFTLQHTASADPREDTAWISALEKQINPHGLQPSTSHSIAINHLWRDTVRSFIIKDLRESQSGRRMHLWTAQKCLIIYHLIPSPVVLQMMNFHSMNKEQLNALQPEFFSHFVEKATWIYCPQASGACFSTVSRPKRPSSTAWEKRRPIMKIDTSLGPKPLDSKLDSVASTPLPVSPPKTHTYPSGFRVVSRSSSVLSFGSCDSFFGTDSLSSPALNAAIDEALEQNTPPTPETPFSMYPVLDEEAIHNSSARAKPETVLLHDSSPSQLYGKRRHPSQAPVLRPSQVRNCSSTTECSMERIRAVPQSACASSSVAYSHIPVPDSMVDTYVRDDSTGGFVPFEFKAYNLLKEAEQVELKRRYVLIHNHLDRLVAVNQKSFKERVKHSIKGCVKKLGNLARVKF